MLIKVIELTSLFLFRRKAGFLWGMLKIFISFHSNLEVLLNLRIWNSKAWVHSKFLKLSFFYIYFPVFNIYFRLGVMIDRGFAVAREGTYTVKDTHDYTRYIEDFLIRNV